MFGALQDLFSSITSPGSNSPASPDATEHAVRLAAAVLLVEVMRADPKIEPAERKAVMEALQARFSLSETELRTLVTLAEAEAREAYDFHRFTSSLNDRFTQQQKVDLIEAMWQVAYSDAHLDPGENHVISKVAGLLHVTHGEYIAAKLRAKEASGHS